MKKSVLCPQCGAEVSKYRNPFPTADVIIYHPGRGIVLVKRGHAPLGMALPAVLWKRAKPWNRPPYAKCARKRALTWNLRVFSGVYSAPNRDPRFHTMTVTFVGQAADPDALNAGDDAAEAAFILWTLCPALSASITPGPWTTFVNT